MLRRLFSIIVVLALSTTFLTIQQTHRYRVHHGIPQDLQKDNSIFLRRKKLTLNRLERHHKASLGRYNSKTHYERRNLVLRSQASASQRKYILPILFYNMGPNNVFRIFKETIPIALALNRTLIVPPFHHHPRMKLPKETKGTKTLNDHVFVEIQIFDEMYKSVMVSDPNQVIDFKLLQKHMAVESAKTFVHECGNKVDLMVECGDVSGKRAVGLQHFTAFNNVTFARKHHVTSLSDISDKSVLKLNLKKLQSVSANQNCIALAIGAKCLGNREDWFQEWKKFSPFVRRPETVTTLAKRFVSEVLSKNKFLAVHWRYDYEDWQDMCKESRPDSVRDINLPMCEMAKQIHTNITFVNRLMTKLYVFSEKIGTQAIYIASPPQLTDALSKLKRKWPSVYTIRDVEKFSKSNDDLWMTIFETNFGISFLEQEICYYSKYFLGSPLSSWTQTVLLDRVSDDNQEHGSVLEAIADQQSSLFPKLTWYFPEGN